MPLDALGDTVGLSIGCGEHLMDMDLNPGSSSTSLVIFSSLSLGVLIGKLRPDNNRCLLALRPSGRKQC